MTTIGDITPGFARSALWRFRMEVIVRWIAGTVLLVAASLKAHQIATEPMHGDRWGASRPLAILIAEYQGILGVILLSGLWPRQIRWVTVATYTIFCGFAAFESWAGNPSCGCFGAVQVEPKYTMVLDGVIGLSLLLTMPTVVGTQQKPLGKLLLSLGIFIWAILIPPMNGHRLFSFSNALELVADSNVFDFGALKPSESSQLVHAFHVSNNSARPLRIIAAKSSCGCTVASIPDKPIPAGGSADITVTAKWQGRYGPQREEVLLSIDGPTQSTLPLAVKATIVAPAVYWPNVLDFGDVVQGQASSRFVVIAPGAKQADFEVLSANSDDPSLHFTRMSDSGSEHEWRIDLLSKSVGQSIRTRAKFSLIRSSESTINVPVTYTVLPAVRAVPQSLVFWAKQEGQVRQITAFSTNEIRNVSVGSEIPSDTLTAHIVSSSREGGTWRYVIEVRLSLYAVDRLTRSTLSLEGEPYSGELPILLIP